MQWRGYEVTGETKKRKKIITPVGVRKENGVWRRRMRSTHGRRGTWDTRMGEDGCGGQRGKRAAYQACKIKKKMRKEGGERDGGRRRSSSFSGIREVGRTLTWREALMLNCFMALKLYFLIILCAFIALLASTNE
jgi:hypothetical protein